MKNALRVIAIVVVAALLFGVGYSMGSSKGINITVQYSNAGGESAPSVNTQTQAPQTTAPAPQTTAPAPQTTAPAPSDAPATDDAPETDAPETDAPAADDKGSKIPSSIPEIVAAYNKAINDTKAFQGTVSVHKVGDMSITLEDCTVSFLTDQINGIMQGLISDTDSSWTFTNGQHVWEDGAITELKKVVPPGNGGGKDAALTEAGVATATATDNGNGTYTMDIALVAEKSTYDGTNTVNPVHNESVVDPLNLATLEIPVVTITKADMNYPGTKLKATVNGDGLLTQLIVELPMEGGGTGKLGVSLDVVISGGNVDTYDFTY